ncbi:MAG: Smr/MutS family protein [Bacteroidetes bacterium]|nr:Smr/MutS family protein [Bacteroidota bacterium]
MNFKVGEHVRFLNETGEGIIKSFKGKNMALVEIESGFEIPFFLNQLVKISADEIKKGERNRSGSPSYSIAGVKRVILEKAEAEAKNKKASQKHKRKGEHIVEVDLHIENLVGGHSHLSNGQIVVIQLNVFEKKLEAAIRNKVDRIVFIHGVGNGVLKAEIRKVLNNYETLVFFDASYTKYGYGATEVIIK